jgi:hypothetical protein
MHTRVFGLHVGQHAWYFALRLGYDRRDVQVEGALAVCTGNVVIIPREPPTGGKNDAAGGIGTKSGTDGKLEVFAASEELMLNVGAAERPKSAAAVRGRQFPVLSGT